MADYHRLLKRQFRRHLRGHETDLESIKPLLQAVSQAYDQQDQDRKLLEKAMELSSEELTRANNELRILLRSLPDQVFQLDATGKILFYHQGSGDSSIIDQDVWPVGRFISEFLPADAERRLMDSLEKSIGCDSEEQLEFNIERDNAPQYYNARIRPLGSRRCIVVIRDVSVEKRSERRILHLAYHDSLTGLPNRIRFQEFLEESMREASDTGSFTAVLFLDLDRFKKVNDTLGHALGDELLVTVADRLGACLRERDLVGRLRQIQPGGSAGSVARMGGDEFTVVLSNLHAPEEVNIVAERILKVVREPINLSGREIVSTVSIGAAVYPIHGKDFSTLVQNADVAMYQAKDDGKNTYKVYDHSMNAEALERMVIESEIRKAIECREFTLHYQPIVSAKGGALVGLEALIRWCHPRKGYIRPDIFISVAEESGLICEVGSLVIEMACEQLGRWLRMGIAPSSVSVNLSGHQIRDHSMANFLITCLRTHGVPPHMIAVELTETATMENSDVAIEVLNRLRQIGIKVSMDDFGTGYSSLAYLQRLPVDILKVDRSFIRDFADNPQDAGLIRAIISMGHVLGLEVVAEGVETQEQMSFLQENDCDYIQGYFVERPVDAEALEPYLREAAQALKLPLVG